MRAWGRCDDSLVLCYERRAINGRRSETYPSSVSEAANLCGVMMLHLLHCSSNTSRRAPRGAHFAPPDALETFFNASRGNHWARAYTARFWNIKSVSTRVIPLVSYPGALQAFYRRVSFVLHMEILLLRRNKTNWNWMWVVFSRKLFVKEHKIVLVLKSNAF